MALSVTVWHSTQPCDRQADSLRQTPVCSRYLFMRSSLREIDRSAETGSVTTNRRPEVESDIERETTLTADRPQRQHGH